MKEIKLSKGELAFVDDDDFTRISNHKWFACKYGISIYAKRNVILPNGKHTTVFMHREVAQDIKGRIDHKDRNGLNNCKENLRPTNGSLNQGNRIKRIDATTSQYKGVSWAASNNKWGFWIKCGKERAFGFFSTELDAAFAYDFHARRLFGKHARCNFGPGELL